MSDPDSWRTVRFHPARMKGGQVVFSMRGRLETRLLLTLVVALPWAAALAAAWRPGGGSAWSEAGTAAALTALMGVLGLGWEAVYHLLQQLRQDRDWPSSFLLLAGVLEFGPLWAAAAWLPGGRPAAGLAPTAVIVASAWVLMWLTAQGPLRVLLLRWRFNGGRVLCPR